MRLRRLRILIQGDVPARVWGFESRLRHQLLTDQRLHRYYLMRRSLAGTFPAVRPARRETAVRRCPGASWA
jgi:hypothetical protein